MAQRSVPQSSNLRPPTLADPAACDDCTLAPGSLQRVREMAALREGGWSLDEIAVRYRVSRERVRQILIANGGLNPASVAEARRRRAESLAEAHIDDLLLRWRAGQDPGSVAAELGLQAAACRSTIERFASEVDRAARRANLARTRRRGAKLYSDRDILVALTSVAARVGRVPSPKEYAALARELDFPSLPTVLKRMGGWTRAVKAAGMTPLSEPRRTRTQRWTQEACWEALQRVARELGEIPSVLAYERHAAKRDDLPSSATVRNRLGRWSAITMRLAAERELATLRAQTTAQSELA